MVDESKSINEGNWHSLVEEFNLLPSITDLLQSIVTNPDAKETDAHEKRIAEMADALCHQFIRCQNLIDALHGTDMSPAQQQEQYAGCAQKVRQRTEMIQKYAELKALRSHAMAATAEVSGQQTGSSQGT